MKNNIPCEMIKDVLPSYVDKLTSDVTNNLVEEHINECEDCKNTLDLIILFYSIILLKNKIKFYSHIFFIYIRVDTP